MWINVLHYVCVYCGVLFMDAGNSCFACCSSSVTIRLMPSVVGFVCTAEWTTQAQGSSHTVQWQLRWILHRSCFFRKLLQGYINVLFFRPTVLQFWQKFTTKPISPNILTFTMLAVIVWCWRIKAREQKQLWCTEHAFMFFWNMTRVYSASMLVAEGIKENSIPHWKLAPHSFP